MKNIEEKSEVQFSVANDINNHKRIHISEAESGDNGYYCCGCNAKMIAIKGDNSKRQHYFRHHPKEIHKHKNCTYSDESGLHLLAKDILQIKKTVKVPPVFIDIPNENGGGKYQLKKPDYIEADEVWIERYIYEDENGNICFSHKEDSSKFLLIKPDVIFVKQGKPILLIEIFVKHEVDDEKLAKIKRLGINAIEVKIPKISDKSEMDVIFESIKYTKWLFNYEQATTKFSPAEHQIRGRDNNTIIDEEGFYTKEESFGCRTFRLREAIRGVTKLIQSSNFEKLERKADSEIIRIEENTKRVREQLRVQEEAFDREAEIIAISEYAERISTIRERLKTIEREQRERSSSIEELDKYIREQNKLAREQAETRIDQRLKSEGKVIEQAQSRIRELEEKYKHLEERYRIKDAELNREEIRFGEEESRVEREQRELEWGKISFDPKTGDFERRIKRIRESIEDKERELTEAVGEEYRIEENFKPTLDNYRQSQQTEETNNRIKQEIGKFEKKLEVKYNENDLNKLF